MEYLLYNFDDAAEVVDCAPLVPGRVVELALFGRAFLISGLAAGGTDALKSLLLATWSVLTGAAHFRDFRVFAYMASSGELLHYSLVSPAALHMPWLGESERGSEIGGCLTVASARGKRIYPAVLRHIAANVSESRPLYMIVDRNNAASQAGMKRAGFSVSRPLYRHSSLIRPPHYEITLSG